jgi:hypothetical protein
MISWYLVRLGNMDFVPVPKRVFVLFGDINLKDTISHKSVNSTHWSYSYDSGISGYPSPSPRTQEHHFFKILSTSPRGVFRCHHFLAYSWPGTTLGGKAVLVFLPTIGLTMRRGLHSLTSLVMVLFISCAASSRLVAPSALGGSIPHPRLIPLRLVRP